jgi:hypothetical protein
MDFATYKSKLMSMNYGQIVALLVDDVNRSHLSPFYRKAILDQLVSMNNQLMPVKSNVSTKSDTKDDIVDDILSNIGSEEYSDDEEAKERIMRRLKKSATLINKIQRRGT